MPRPLETNLLTKFHEALTINVASKVLTRKNAPPPGGHVFIETIPIFELIQDIIRTNLLTKFHKDKTINVASRMLTRKNALPPGSHVFQPISIIFELVQDIIRMNLLTMFHEDRTINVASRVKNAPPLGSHVFQANITIFKLIQDIIETNLLTKFHEDWTMRPLETIYNHIRKNAPPPGGHFHENLTKNVASRVKNTPPLGSHVFQANLTIFELIQDIIETNLLTKFHEDWTMRPLETIYNHIRKNAPPPGGHFHENLTINVASRENAPPHKCHVFQPTGVILKLVKDIIGLNLLIKFHEDRTMNVASRVINAPLDDKFHEDWTINAASRVSTMQMLMLYNARRTKGDHKSSP
ncbi:hypothetical protein DPMN_028827 [Dreissena polymorpha]|uniref:Uncharacterized protein n=1 Tax=Dreissena polymorpha TaxID=45954 RepID=A0A9D4REX0_DREPO|nr:hypothetical protein DPMN_028827 [Dreissena polymorpha]